MLEIEPAAEVTAGLANAGGFDLEAIEVAMDKVVDYLHKHGNTSYREIALLVKQMGTTVGEDELKEEHIRQIVATLVFD